MNCSEIIIIITLNQGKNKAKRYLPWLSEKLEA